MSDAADAVQPGTIAVIGLSGRFPGAASPAALWANLRAGVESITFLTDEQLRGTGVSAETLRDPNYVKALGRLDDIDRFDAAFFGMSPRDAAVFDPQHRLFLECAWEAFEDAGHVGESFGGPVGVFASCGAAEYFMHNVLRSRQTMESMGAWLARHNGNDPNFLATRASYELNLTGPSLSVQSACSSSLLAVHVACQSLLSGECDMALAGGATIYVEQNRGYHYKPGEILSPDGHCRTFDARAAGTVMASAVGCVVLRRLEDALRDGDRVLAVIRGSAVNNDGSRKVGYLAPSASGQTDVVIEALAMAGVDAQDVSYIEAHGTATPIGDPIEVAALTDAFRATTDATQFCAIGSLKSNIGHAGEAAGICSFIKTVLALAHRQIPPSLHYETPNPQIDFAASPFFVNTTLRDWVPAKGKPRIAGVTGLGAGGTNVHVLVEEAPAQAPPAPARREYQVLALSARTPAALEAMTHNLAAHLRANADLSLADVAFTLSAGRKAFAHRRSWVVRDHADALAALEGSDPKRTIAHVRKSEHAPPICFMFPGGGAQYAGMGVELYDREPVYREAFDAALACMEPALREDLRAFLRARSGEDDATRRLEVPSRAVTLLFATEYAVATLLRSWGIQPSAMIGHSAGEYAVACLAGVLTLRDAVALASLRGRLFDTLPEGAMLSVSLATEEALRIVGADLSVAAVNAPTQCVLSGPTAAVARAEQALRVQGVDCARVHIRVAAHSTMLDPVLPDFERFCRTVSFRKPTIPFISCVTGTWIGDDEAVDPAYWVRHLRHTVRFADALQTATSAGAVALVEVGPGRALTGFARQHKGDVAIATPTMRHPQEAASDVAFLLAAIGRLWASGVDVDLSCLIEGAPRRRLSLPTYPFERQRFWIDPDPRSADEARGADFEKRDNVSEWFYAPSWARSAPPAVSSNANEAISTWLVFADESPLSEAVLEALRDAGRRVVVALPGGTFEARTNGRFTLDPSNRSHFDALAKALHERGIVPGGVLHLWAAAPRLRGTKPFGRRDADPLDAYDRHLALHYYSLVFTAQAFAADVGALRIVCVSSGMQAIPGDVHLQPEKSVLLGPCKVIPREYPHVRCTSIDVALVAGAEASLAGRVLRELQAPPGAGEIALRGGDRWIRRYDAVALEPAARRSWLREGGAYLITGGLGGIGLRVAHHLAASSASVRLALLARTAVPDGPAADAWLASHAPTDDTSARILAVRALRARGAEVMTISADVADPGAMRAAFMQLRRRFGRLDGVFHAAGTLKDEIIAMRSREARSDVLDSKMKGALVLDALLAEQPPDFLVLFSSVASILGLPGQVDYTAANAFLDALAHARCARGSGRTVAIDWNAWQGVGMLHQHVRHLRHATHAAEEVSMSTASLPSASRHPLLGELLVDEPAITLFRTVFDHDQAWLLHEHVVRGGDALIPGTGMLEIARAALEHRAEARAVELRDVFFVEPFRVAQGTARTMHVRIDRGSEEAFTIYGETPDDVFVVGKARHVDAPDAPRLDLDRIRSRCATRGLVDGRQLVQHFMDFGPRWRTVSRIDLGRGEALVGLELPDPFDADLEHYRLHPALLDLATGGAQAIVPGFEPRTSFYVPAAYGRVLVHRPLQRRVVSHVRLRDDSSADTIAFDATIVDEQGATLVSIERFVMRKVSAEFRQPSAHGTAETQTAAHRPETAAEAALRIGMTVEQGLDALDRILATDFSPQVVACTVPLEAWLERIERESRRSAEDGGDDAGPLFARPSIGTTFAAPRDDLERELASLWRRLLGVDEVGIHDDFFELGGQSLIALRLFQRIGKTYGVELPLATLFQAPTIAECAALLRSHLGRADPGDDASPPDARPPAQRAFRSLVTVQAGRDRVPFFCVHGAGGNVLNFRDLAQSMHPDQPFYGLQASGVDGVSPLHTTIEEMAEAYIAEMRVVQPEGPYLLGGYSGGGVIAFEMARRLTAAGHAVGLLAFIDTFHPGMTLREITVSTRLQRLATEGLAYVKEGLERRRLAAEVVRDDRTIDDCIARGEPVPAPLRDRHVYRNFQRALDRYRIRPWQGRAILFRAQTLVHYLEDGGEAYGWDTDVLGGVDVVKVPGNHSSLLLGANATLLVGSLGAAIERAATAASGAAPKPVVVRPVSQNDRPVEAVGGQML